jgi:hypothetical protein
MGLVSSSKKLLYLEALLEQSTCKPVQALRLKYGGLPKAEPPWCSIPLVHLPASAINDYRKAVAQITSVQTQFGIRVGRLFRSYAQTLKIVALDLSSDELGGIHKQLIHEME